jgi:CRISPR-associated endonuclease/helicase Cas3
MDDTQDTIEPIARAKQDENGNWQEQKLRDHLAQVAALAEKFASEFGNGDWGALPGLWHDLGKFTPAWQKYIRKRTGYQDDIHFADASGQVNHSDAGMIRGFQLFEGYPPAGRILAYIIGGHHAGLPDWSPGDVGGELTGRLYSNIECTKFAAEPLDKLRGTQASEFMNQKCPHSSPMNVSPSSVNFQEHLHLWVRMLFSCLTDADFLDTEEFMKPKAAALRGHYAGLMELKTLLDTYMLDKIGKAILSPLNAARARILSQCREKAQLTPGFFSLQVPTGGGKTLASMSFALDHAIKHGKRRVIMAIPYTSIIEQNADVYREVFGSENILEHHSGLDPEKETAASVLAAENWDAPIIVTTNVQLFESLFAAKTSMCRKIHNLANSVIILDEAQVLPPEYLLPVLSVLRGLVDYFGVTVVLCTATQPVFAGEIGSGKACFQGIQPCAITHIIDDPDTLAKELRRVEFITTRCEETLESWEVLADELTKLEQVLCIVNTRSDCRELHKCVHTRISEGTIHLSAFMCPEERSYLIENVIRHRLKNGLPIRVISTQLVEAGVDIDFPVVYRALAGIDSLVQAAGRCNREGFLNTNGGLGKVVVFRPPKQAPPGILRKGEQASAAILLQGKVFDAAPDTIYNYFHKFYSDVNTFDKKDFAKSMLSEPGENKFQFRTFAKEFRLIDDAEQTAIIVRYCPPKDDARGSAPLIKELEFMEPNRALRRKLGRYSVTIPRKAAAALLAEGAIHELHGIFVQQSPNLYQEGIGLVLNTAVTEFLGI